MAATDRWYESSHGRAPRRISARPSLRRDVRGGRAAASAHAGAVRRPADAHRRGPGAAGGGPGPQLPRPGRHLLPRRRGVGLPARPDPAADPGGRVGTRRSGRRAAGTRAGGVPRRRLRAGRGGPGRGGAALAAHHLGQLLPAGARHPPAERRADPPRRDRPRPRPGGRPAGARGQPAGAVRNVLCGGEPADHGARLPRAVPGAAGAAGRLLPGAAARRAAAVGAGRRRGAHRGAAHPWRAQPGLLRARLPGPQDGHRAGRGPGPVLPRARPLHAQHRGAAAGGRRLPAGQRRLPRPGALPARLGRGVPGHPERGPRRQRHDRQRDRQRRRRRQADLHLRPGAHRVLPRRAAVAAQRRDLPARRSGRPRRSAWPGSTSWW